VGIAVERERSYIEMTLELAAKFGSDRWCETPVKAVSPRYVAKGGFPEDVLYGSKTLIDLSLAQLINL